MIAILTLLAVATVNAGNVLAGDLQSLVNQMRQLDCNGARLGAVSLVYQGKCTPDNYVDNSDDDLMVYIFPNLTNTAQYNIYYSLIPYFNPNVDVPEIDSLAKRALITSFLNAVMDTKVFNVVWNYLISQGLASSDYATFQNYLRTIWFGLYSRASDGTTKGSSGFEHVFLGEQEDASVNGKYPNVGGLHHWARYWMLQKAGLINYHGYIEHDGFLVSTIQFGYNGYQKHIGGFMVGTTLAFDFSLNTLCWMVFPDTREDCAFKIDGYPLAITAWTLTDPDDDSVKYVASTYSRITGKRQNNN